MSNQVEVHTLIRDEYRKEFFAMDQREQFKTLVRRAIIDVYGSSWTTPDSRERIAEDAARGQDSWDDELRRSAELYSLEERIQSLESALHIDESGEVK